MFFPFDLRVYFATFTSPGKGTWLRFEEIWETFFTFIFYTLNVVLNSCSARFFHCSCKVNVEFFRHYSTQKSLFLRQDFSGLLLSLLA